MKSIRIKDVMIPISDYMTIKEEDTLFDVFHMLEKNKKASTKHAHRDAIVINDKGEFKGKVTMIDLFRALEPNYKNLMKDYKKGVLKKEYVMKAVKDFNLWLEPIQSLCERGTSIIVSEVMHIPEDHEYIQEEDSFEKALHEYVMEVHQPLIVKKDDKITGVLRFGDLFEVIRKQMLACPI